jgi:hypothetical protein
LQHTTEVIDISSSWTSFRARADRAVLLKMLVAADRAELGIAFDAGARRFRTAHRLITPLTSIRDVAGGKNALPAGEQIRLFPVSGRRTMSLFSCASHFEGLSLRRTIRDQERANIERKTLFGNTP